MIDLMNIAVSTQPKIPNSILTLNPLDGKPYLTQPNGTTKCLSQ